MGGAQKQEGKQLQKQLMAGKFLSIAGRIGLFRSELRSKMMVTEDLYFKFGKYPHIICIKQTKGGKRNLITVRRR
jgi:hypothetical protein